MQQAKKVSHMFKKRNECEPHGNLSVDLNKFLFLVFSVVGFFFVLFCFLLFYFGCFRICACEGILNMSIMKKILPRILYFEGSFPPFFNRFP